MSKDPIVEKIRKIREKHATRFEYDLDAICRDLKEQERKSGRRVVSLPAKKPARGAKTGWGESITSSANPSAGLCALEEMPEKSN